jgi:hypothetical protein
VQAHVPVTDRKSLLALRGVGPESEAESVRFHGRKVTKVGPEVKHFGCKRDSRGGLSPRRAAHETDDWRCMRMPSFDFDSSALLCIPRHISP